MASAYSKTTPPASSNHSITLLEHLKALEDARIIISVARSIPYTSAVDAKMMRVWSYLKSQQDSFDLSEILEEPKKSILRCEITRPQGFDPADEVECRQPGRYCIHCAVIICDEDAPRVRCDSPDGVHEWGDPPSELAFEDATNLMDLTLMKQMERYH